MALQTRLKRAVDVLYRSDLGGIAACWQGCSRDRALSQLDFSSCFSAMPEAVDERESSTYPKHIMAVSAKSLPGKTYGYLIGRLTEGHRVLMKCTGTPAVHAATKTIAITRGRLQAHNILGGDDIVVRIAHQDGADEDWISKYVISVDRVSADILSLDGKGEEPLWCGARARPRQIGASLLLHANDGRAVLGKAMGADPVSKMMAGFAIARKRAIAMDIDLICLPEYREEEVKARKNSTTTDLRKVLNFMFRTTPYNPEMDIPIEARKQDERKKVREAVPSSTETTSPSDAEEEGLVGVVESARIQEQ